MLITDTEYKGTMYRVCNGTYYHESTTADVIRAIETARINKTRVRIFLGDTTTGKAWEEENDVCGTIGRSTGAVKVPLLIANSRSLGGGVILDHCIIGIIDRPQHFLYKHPSFHTDAFECVPSDMSEYKSMVTSDGKTIARFKHEDGARRWIDFMTGNRMSK